MRSSFYFEDSFKYIITNMENGLKCGQYKNHNTSQPSLKPKSYSKKVLNIVIFSGYHSFTILNRNETLQTAIYP